jgi:hypothetical protein
MADFKSMGEPYIAHNLSAIPITNINFHYSERSMADVRFQIPVGQPNTLVIARRISADWKF